MIETSIQALIQGDFNTRWQAAKTLKTFGEEAHERLIAIAESSYQDPDLQGFIVSILGTSSTPKILLTLITLLKRSSDDELKETIVLTLGQQGPSQVEALLNLAEQPELQASVLRALVQINHPNTIKGLEKFATHENNEFRTLALEALGQFHGEQISILLKQGLKDISSPVRSVCVKALGLRQSHEVDETLVTDVSGLLYDINPQVCVLATKALGRFNHPLALQYLWRRLIEQSTPTLLSQSLIQALGWSSHPIGIHYLCKLLTLITSKDPESRIGKNWPPQLINDLIQTIATIDISNDTSKKVDEIAQQLTDLLLRQVHPFDDIQVQQRLIMAIARLGQDASIGSLIQALAIEDDRIRFHLIAALKQINPELSQEKLTTCNHSDLEPTLNAGIAMALREW